MALEWIQVYDILKRHWNQQEFSVNNASSKSILIGLHLTIIKCSSNSLCCHFFRVKCMFKEAILMSFFLLPHVLCFIFLLVRSEIQLCIHSLAFSVRYKPRQAESFMRIMLSVCYLKQPKTVQGDRRRLISMDFCLLFALS